MSLVILDQSIEALLWHSAVVRYFLCMATDKTCELRYTAAAYLKYPFENSQLYRTACKHILSPIYA
ncbi:hypothetical protein L2744_20975 [Shewanella profunda]|uniref:hypothetical protein n=1 Tax=Shewanella profunda TaxID=254793 RepID=UPI00200F4944|nr:hypothetical protein [Shewanella profunda]MCL1092027.1 hypothetical protein [Shewanella profunda]